MNPDTQQQLLNLVSELLAKKDVRLEHKFSEDLGADSLDMINLAMEAENRFNVEIPDETLAGFKTVEDLFFFIEQYERNR